MVVCRPATTLRLLSRRRFTRVNLIPAHASRHATSARPPSHSTSQGVDCGEVTLVVHVRPCEGLVRGVDGTIEKRFAKKEVPYPLEVGRGGVGGDGCLWMGL